MNTNHKLTLTMLAGISIGLIAGQAIRAQQVRTPPAYIIAEVERDPSKTGDPNAMKKYAQEVPKTLAAFGAQFGYQPQQQDSDSGRRSSERLYYNPRFRQRRESSRLVLFAGVRSAQTTQREHQQEPP